jgi:hypothetical protein
VAVEITSPSDAPELPWTQKLDRYCALGVEHLVRFDPDDEQSSLRIWDRVEGDLVERDPSDPAFSRCEPLEAYWQVLADPQTGLSLRLSRDSAGKDLLRTPLEIKTEEHRREAEEHRREAEEHRREAEARAAAEQLAAQQTEARARAEEGERRAKERVRELEAELAKRSRG